MLEPKLEVMSLRTMPLSVSTLVPLEPSPGYGPAVSSGSSPFAVSLVSPLSGWPPPGGPPPGPPLGAPLGDPSEPGVASVVVADVAQAPRVTRPAPARPAPATSFSMPATLQQPGQVVVEAAVVVLQVGLAVVDAHDDQLSSMAVGGDLR